MKVRVVISRLLAALAIFGLVLGPLAPLSMAMTPGTADVSLQAIAEMPADMPCCPDQAPAKDCTKDCPFMLMCAGQYVQGRVGGPGLPIPRFVSSLALPGNDAVASSLSPRPLPKPPKFLA